MQRSPVFVLGGLKRGIGIRFHTVGVMSGGGPFVMRFYFLMGAWDSCTYTSIISCCCCCGGPSFWRPDLTLLPAAHKLSELTASSQPASQQVPFLQMLYKLLYMLLLWHVPARPHILSNSASPVKKFETAKKWPPHDYYYYYYV